MWLNLNLNLLSWFDTMVPHFRIRITKYDTGAFWQNKSKSFLFWAKCCIRTYPYRYSVTGNARRPISAVLLVLYVTTIRQTVRYTQRPVWLKIYAIRITLYPFPTPYNGFFTGFLRFFKKIQIQFSQERELRLQKLKWFLKWFGGVYKRLLFRSNDFRFEILRAPPSP